MILVFDMMQTLTIDGCCYSCDFIGVPFSQVQIYTCLAWEIHGAHAPLIYICIAGKYLLQHETAYLILHWI